MDNRSGHAPAIIDVEASGFGTGSYPIEVGFVLPDASAQCYLIRPQPQWTHWDAAAEALHGISREVLMNQGLEVAEVAHILNTHLKGLDVYSDAWGYDQSWLAGLFEAAAKPQRFRVRHLRQLMTESQLQEWDQAKIRVIKELGVCRHRASMDARILQTTFMRTREGSAFNS